MADEVWTRYREARDHISLLAESATYLALSLVRRGEIKDVGMLLRVIARDLWEGEDYSAVTGEDLMVARTVLGCHHSTTASFSVAVCMSALMHGNLTMVEELLDNVCTKYWEQ